MFALFKSLDAKDKREVINKLITNSSPRQAFFLMIFLSIAMASLGLLIDNLIIVIGSMLIAPMLYPIIGFSMGLAALDIKLIQRSFLTIIKSILGGLLIAAAVAFFFKTNGRTFDDIIATTHSASIYFFIAFLAGAAVSVAITKKYLSESVPGVAIAVALIPPLAASGIYLSRFEWQMVFDYLVIFALNIVGILLASFIIFFLMNFSSAKRSLGAAIKKDEKEIEEKMKKK